MTGRPGSDPIPVPDRHDAPPHRTSRSRYHAVACRPAACLFANARCGRGSGRRTVRHAPPLTVIGTPRGRLRRPIPAPASHAAPGVAAGNPYRGDDLQVYSYDQHDEITLTDCHGSPAPFRVAGGWDGDTVTLTDCSGIQVDPVSPAEGQNNPNLHDTGDLFVITRTVNSTIDGGEGDDQFRLSGFCNGNAIIGGYDTDTVSGVATFNGRIFSGIGSSGIGDNPDPSNPLNVSVGGLWNGARIHGSSVGDTINCRQTHSAVTKKGVSVWAYAGADTVYGGKHNDYLHGGEGADHLYGGDGNDVLYAVDGHAYNDFLSGGAGSDTARCDDPGENFWVDPNTGALDIETFEFFA
jgi:Ca2+-binding RTX toxin-like protein